MTITSATPGIFSSRGRTTQSAVVRRSIRRLSPIGRSVRNADVHDLPHDRADRGHLRADARRQRLATVASRSCTVCRARGFDVPAELDVDDEKGRCRTGCAPPRRRSREQRRFERERDQRFDLFRGPGRALGHDRHARPVEVGKHVDRQLRGDIRAIQQHRQAGKNHQRPITQSKVYDSV